MARGGIQKPQGPRPPAGPGRFSQRNDGNQPVKTPGLDSPDMQYGDVQKMHQAMSTIPLPEAGSAPTSRPMAPGAAQVMPQRGDLPDFVTQSPTNRPNEPGTEGLTTGPGAGPEVLPTPPATPAEQALTMVWQLFGNPKALELLNRLRDESATPQAPQGPPPAA